MSSSFYRGVVRCSLILCWVVGFLFPLNNSNASWTKVSQFSAHVTCGFFTDQYNGIIGADRAYSPLFVTHDGGKTWSAAKVPSFTSGAAVSDIWFSSPLLGWATLNNTIGTSVWYTTDGGNSWDSTNFNMATNCVRATSHALVVSQFITGAGIYISTDHGKTYPKKFASAMNGIDFVDDLNGVCASTQNGEYYFTHDGGQNWFPATSVGTTFYEAYGVYGVKGTGKFFTAPELSVDATAPSPILESTDYGETWEKVADLPIGSSGDIEGSGTMLFIQAAWGSGSGTDGLFRSMDEGRTWTNIGGPTRSKDTRFCVTGCGNVIFAFDDGGGIWRCLDGGDGKLLSSCGLAEDLIPDDSASLCFETDRRQWLHNPFDSTVTLVSIQFRDSALKAVKSGAISLDSLPTVPTSFQSYDSTSFLLRWNPRIAFTSRDTEAITIRVIYYVGTLKLFDTLDYPFDALATVSPPSIGLSSRSIIDPTLSTCSIFDTLLHLTNTSCDTLVVSQAKLTIGSHWMLLDTIGSPIAFPILLAPDNGVSLLLRFAPHSVANSYDTVRVSIGNFGIDTTLLVPLLGRGRVGTALSVANAVGFDSVGLCSYADSTFRLANTGCDTLYLTSTVLNVGAWMVFDSVGNPLRLPVAVPPNASSRITIRFKPAGTGAESGTLDLHFRYEGVDSERVVALTGYGVTTGTLEVTNNLNFGQISSCLTADSTLLILNGSCDSILLDSVTLLGSGAFSFPAAIALPVWMSSGDAISVHVHFIPHAGVNEQDTLRVKYLLGKQIGYRTLIISGEGIPPPITCSLSTDRIDLGQRSICGGEDTNYLTLRNGGCDTLSITSANFPANLTKLFGVDIPTLPIKVPPDSTFSLEVIFTPADTGIFAGTLKIGLASSSGETRDTLIPCTVEVAGATRSISVDSSQIDFGAVSVCATRDTSVVIRNSGCALITLLNAFSKNGIFVIRNSHTLPDTLAQNESDTIVIEFSFDSAGKATGQLILQTDANSSGTITIPVTASVVPPDTALFSCFVTPKAAPDESPVTIDVITNTAIVTKVLQSISGTVSYNADMLAGDPTVRTLIPNATLAPVQFVSQNSRMQVGFNVTGSPYLSIPAGTVIFEMTGISILTDSLSTFFTLDSISLDAANPEFESCTLVPRIKQSGARFTIDTTGCGEGMLSQSLSGKLAISNNRVQPNPVSSESRVVRLRFTSAVHANANIAIYNSTGVLVASTGREAVIGENVFEVPIQTLTAGTCWYRISINLPNSNILQGSFILLH